MKRKIKLGCVADDFTGASDICSFLAAIGLKTILFNGIPQNTDIVQQEADAIVIALKTRTADVNDAVKKSIDAIKVLKKVGAEILYEKYCSSFDSTAQGNIGPISDAILEELDEKYTVLCPSLPINGRTVHDGLLYISGIPLSKSSMKNHPLTPMTESNVSLLMQKQSKYPTFILDSYMMQKTKKEILQYVEAKGRDFKHFYIVPEFQSDCDALKIAKVFDNLSFYTGGSGLPPYLIQDQCKNSLSAVPYTEGDALILAGSCSKMTRSQIDYYQKQGGFSYRIDQRGLLQGLVTSGDVWKIIDANKGKDVLVYSSGSPTELALMTQEENRLIADLLEKIIAEIALMAVKKGYSRLIVAGGETSGAVVKKLGLSSYIVSKSVAPGVPVMVPLENKKLRIVLKSGNFGKVDFFEQALRLTHKQKI